MNNLLLAPIRYGLDIFHKSTFIRYVFSGGTAAAIDVALLYILVEYFHVYYISAAIFSMTVSFIARFLLQKYVTFEDKDESHATRQFVYYTILYFASLCATTALLYLFVEKLNFWYLPSQIAAILLIASGCFFIYRLFIFKK